jgi:hypothetical protein
MGTEINKNKNWTSPTQIIRRRKKVTEPAKKVVMNNIINQFVSAIKLKHM